tara:strand:+ start:85958 stop:86950 length:993 start_codon:yes stop_codon:yes gene_type:complete
MADLDQDTNLRRVLVVDDDELSQQILSKTLEMDGYQVQVASDGNEALTVINNWYPHLILLDINMPGLDGMQTLKNLRQKTNYVSTIFISANSNPEDIIKGLDAGADDYITKPFDPLVMLSRVRTQLRIKDIRDDLRRVNGRLQELVEIDDLTGLFNMRSLYSKLQNEVERSARYGRSLCVLMMDMDHFKNVNDDHDHLFGSFVLSEVGKIIRENIRKVDFAARYGGDEFLIVLAECTPEGAEKFAQRLGDYISKHEFKNENHSIHLTTSIGYAVTDSEHPYVNGKELVRVADKALYTAKEDGRNCIRSVDLGLNPDAIQKSRRRPDIKIK